MQKNNKQWMCTFLSIILCLSFLLPCVAESDAEQWDNSGAREYYLGILEDLEVFQSDEYLYYWRTVNSIEKDEFLAFAIDLGAKVIEKYPTKEDYGRVLSYVLTMQQINIAANISEQSAFDDFRNTGDYVLDVTDIVLSLLGIPETTSAISPVVGAFSFGKDTFSATSDSLTYYEMAITDYVCSDLFLKALIDNTDDEMLKAVAHTFLNENVSLLNKKLEIIGDCGESAAGNLGNYYIENIFFKTLQALDGTDMESVRWLGKAGEGFYNAVISTPKLAFDITMLAGNSLFGTSDQYKTYQEMTILAEVAHSLSCEIQKTDVKNAKGQELEYALNKNYYLYKALIATGCRGEYLFFHLLDDHSSTNRGIIEFFTGKKLLSTDKIDELQEKQFSSIAYYYNVLVKSYQNQRCSICVSHCWEDDRCTICGREKLCSEDTLETDFTAAYEDFFSSEKKLTSIVTYQDNKKAEEYHFSYNGSGLVVELVAYRYEGGDAIEWYTENYEYDSNSNLVLVNRGSSQERYQYDYDANGQIKGYSFAWYVGEILSPASDSYILSYDNQGRIIEKRNESGSDIQEYSYDESGNTVYAIREYSWADGHFLDKTTYDCTYAPLIIQSRTSESAEYGTSSGKSISFMPHWNLSIASGDIGDFYSFEVDSTGRLLTVKDANGGDVYVCWYEENSIDTEQEKTNTLENLYAKDYISFSDIPSEFVFSSGAGSWGTYLTIEADGSFKGEYHDSDMGFTGEGYPRGTVYICDFDGRFTEPQKVSEYVYSMKLESLNVQEPAGSEYIENEIRYIVSEPYGMEKADVFYIYLPGASMVELPETFLSWTQIDRGIRDTLPSGYYGIYNAGGEKGFTATDDNCIWHREYMYHYQGRKAAMWPVYYGMSHLLLWPESGAAVIDLQFAWRNDNQTEFDAQDVNGSGEYHIAFDISNDMLSVNVTVTSSNGIDLSSWGGTSDGHFSAKFVDE